MRDDRGDIILHGLLRLVVGLVVAGLVVFEAGAVVLNRVQLNEAARSAGRVAADVYTPRTRAAAQEAAIARLTREPGMVVEHVGVSGDTLELTVARPASVLLLHRLGPLAEHAQGRVTLTTPLTG